MWFCDMKTYNTNQYSKVNPWLLKNANNPSECSIYDDWDEDNFSFPEEESYTSDIIDENLDDHYNV